MTTQRDRSGPPHSGTARPQLPHLLTVPEVADVLRTSPKAIYTLISRGQLPGVIRLSRRVLVDREDLLSWLTKRRAASLSRGDQ
ncbi:MAG: helix-turn-helix domain-containing protein [Deltaproteobacteria bacterium]|nr:helix-turn-helix domain-containing protein [Deltaproteobacteria bacterium]